MPLNAENVDCFAFAVESGITEVISFSILLKTSPLLAERSNISQNLNCGHDLQSRILRWFLTSFTKSFIVSEAFLHLHHYYNCSTLVCIYVTHSSLQHLFYKSWNVQYLSVQLSVKLLYYYAYNLIIDLSIQFFLLNS